MVVLCGALWLPSAARAQTAGATLLVDARDRSGAPVPGALVTVSSQETGLERVGDDRRRRDGVAGAAAGRHLHADARSAAGSRPKSSQGIQIEAAARGKVTLALKPGDYTEQVVVEADATTLRIGNSAVGAVFDSDDAARRCRSPSAKPLEFATQAPGMAPPAPGSRLSTQGNTGVNSAGAREAANNYLLDGVDNNDQFLNRLVINPSLDAIQEFALLQNTYDAEYGRSAGAQLNMVAEVRARGRGTDRPTSSSVIPRWTRATRSTTAACREAGAPAPPVRRHARRPALDAALVLFHQRRRHQRPRGRHAAGARADARSSAPAISARPASTVRDPFTGLPFPGNVIPASRISAAGARRGRAVPGAQSRRSADQLRRRRRSPTGPPVQFTIKTDHTVWHGSPLTLRYSFSRDNRDQPFPVRARNLPGFGISVLDQGHNFGAGLTKALTARIFNELRVGVNALRRENLAAERRHRSVRRARHHRPAARHRRPRLPDARGAGLRDARRRSQPARACGGRARSTSSTR